MTITYVNSAKEIAQFIIAIITIIGTIITAFRFIHKGQKNQRDGTVALLHDRIYQVCNFYIDREWVTVNDLRNLDYMYRPYHAMGGNDICTELVDRCKKLPIKTEVDTR